TPDPPNDTHPQEDDDRLAQGEAQAADDQTQTEEEGRGSRRRVRAASLDPGAAEGGAQSEQHERRGERRVGRTEPPGLVGEKRLNRPIERAPGVHGPDADMNRHGADWNAPAIDPPGGVLHM